MQRNRMEAFSDGVLAIIITIMVLKLTIPHGTDFSSIKEILPVLLAYVLSYAYVGIYWANHHHLINMVDKVTGKLLWKNLLWMFFMSLLPLATEWMGANPFTKAPTFLYGLILLMCAITYYILQYEVIKLKGKDSDLAKSIGKDLKGKLSVVGYSISMATSFISPIISYIIFILLALIWIVPDSRLEKLK